MPTGDHFDQIVNHLSEGILIVSQEGIVQYANPAAENIFHQKSENILGQPFTYSLYLEKPLEITLNQAAGEMRHYELKITRLPWNGQEAYLATFHDMTLVKKIDLLRAEIGERERLDKIKDDFVGKVSHELRTPLTIVKGAINNLKQGIMGELTEKQSKVVQIADAHLNRLKSLINDLLDLSRLESGTVRMDLKQVDLFQLVCELTDHFQFLAKDKNISILVDSTKNISPVYADSDMIAQVLTNLLANALRFASNTIRVSLTQQSSEILIKVFNDGPRIPEDKMIEIFTKFSQLERNLTLGEYKGTGLGLAISREIIEQHGGRMWAENDEGGVSFNFLLPVYNAQKDIQNLIETAIQWTNKPPTGSTSLEGGGEREFSVGKEEIINAPVSLIVLSFKNMKELKKMKGEEEIRKIMDHLIRDIKIGMLRSSDTIRLHTEKEIVIILPKAGKQGSLSVIRRLQILLQNNPFQLQAHMGFAVCPDDTPHAFSLMDVALTRLS